MNPVDYHLNEIMTMPSHLKKELKFHISDPKIPDASK